MAVPEQLTGKIAPQAWRFGAVLGVLALVMAWLGFAIAASALVGLAVFNFCFFRNPSRTPPPGEGKIVAPGDGRVVEVVQVEDPDGFVGPAWRVAIFLSVFNVHVNRVPVSGKVRASRRSGSKFLAAFNPDASSLNVQARLDIETPGGLRVGVSQITGLIARRIVCYANEGDALVRGEPYGLICYGSRMEIYLPADAKVCVAKGDTARAGETVLAEVAV